MNNTTIILIIVLGSSLFLYQNTKHIKKDIYVEPIPVINPEIAIKQIPTEKPIPRQLTFLNKYGYFVPAAFSVGVAGGVQVLKLYRRHIKATRRLPNSYMIDYETFYDNK